MTFFEKGNTIFALVIGFVIIVSFLSISGESIQESKINQTTLRLHSQNTSVASTLTLFTSLALCEEFQYTGTSPANIKSIFLETGHSALTCALYGDGDTATQLEIADFVGESCPLNTPLVTGNYYKACVDGGSAYYNGSVGVGFYPVVNSVSRFTRYAEGTGTISANPLEIGAYSTSLMIYIGGITIEEMIDTPPADGFLTPFWVIATLIVVVSVGIFFFKSFMNV